jgi:hypothetical protein
VIRAYIANEYPRYMPEAGHLYGLDDELGGGWGRSVREVLAEAEQTLTEWGNVGNSREAHAMSLSAHRTLLAFRAGWRASVDGTVTGAGSAYGDYCQGS